MEKRLLTVRALVTLMALAAAVHGPAVFADEPWILPLDSSLYARAEELYISQGIVPPFTEAPVIAESLRRDLEAHWPRMDQSARAEAEQIHSLLTLPYGPVSPFVDLGFSAATINDPDLGRRISTKRYIAVPEPPAPGTWVAGGTQFLDFNSLYATEFMPPVLSTGFIARTDSLSLLFNPELRQGFTSILDDYNYTNLPSRYDRWDVNFPYRGISTYWSDALEVRFGRDKLNLGPGRWSTLTLNRHVPYFDYVKASFTLPGFSVATYFVRLNPTISKDESNYMDAVYDGIEPFLEQNATYQKINRERSKTLTAVRLSFEPFPWLSVALNQNLLLGGRYPQLDDLNPTNIFHNMFEEGIYSVPATVAIGMTPFKGVYLYGEYLLYDLAVADETGKSTNANASAYQVGFTLLSQPFFSLGPGRFRLDGEWSLADPWTYGKYINLRQMTSRFIYVEPYDGRPWVDFPLGFYLGPDAWELDLKLSYGKAGFWDIFFHWQHVQKGEVDMYGYGEDSDYANPSDFPIHGLLSGIATIRNRFSLECALELIEDISLKAWGRYTNMLNAGHTYGALQSYFDAGISAVWKVY